MGVGRIARPGWYPVAQGRLLWNGGVAIGIAISRFALTLRVRHALTTRAEISVVLTERRIVFTALQGIVLTAICFSIAHPGLSGLVSVQLNARSDYQLIALAKRRLRLPPSRSRPRFELLEDGVTIEMNEWRKLEARQGTSNDRLWALGSRLIHSQNASAVASATPDRKLSASLS
jgi:hypothetical protein